MKAGYRVYYWHDVNDKEKKVLHEPYSYDANKLLSGKINQASNTIDAFTFVLGLGNTYYQKLIPIKGIVQVVNLFDGSIEFHGRILSITGSMSSKGSFAQEVICESFLAYLHDSTQYYKKMENADVLAYFSEMIRCHNEQVEPHKRFQVGRVTLTSASDVPYRYIGYDSSWETIKERIIGKIGGYLSIREEDGIRYLDLLDKLGENRKSPIKLGANIKSSSREVSFDGLITQLVPLGADLNTGEVESGSSADITRKQVDIWSVNNQMMFLEDRELIEQFGIIRKSITWSEIDSPSILKERGQQYLDNQRVALASWKVSVVELSLIDERYEKFVVGNTHPIINAPLSGIEELQITEKEIDILNPQSVDLTIGSSKQSLTAYQLQLQEAKKSIDRVNKDLAVVKSRQEQAAQRERITREITQLESQLKELETRLISEEETNKEEIQTSIEDVKRQIEELRKVDDVGGTTNDE
ncbi:TPA: phage tail protein [Streptococcus suis]